MSIESVWVWIGSVMAPASRPQRPVHNLADVIDGDAVLAMEVRRSVTTNVAELGSKGYTVIPDLLDHETLRAVRDEVDRLIAETPDRSTPVRRLRDEAGVQPPRSLAGVLCLDRSLVAGFDRRYQRLLGWCTYGPHTGIVAGRDPKQTLTTK